MAMIGIVAMTNVHLIETTIDRIIVTDHGVSGSANENVMPPDVIHVNAIVKEDHHHCHVATIHSDAPTILRYPPAWTSIAIKSVTMSGRIFGMASLGPTEMINIRRNDHFQNENETQTMKTTNGVAERRRKLKRPRMRPKKKSPISA